MKKVRTDKTACGKLEPQRNIGAEDITEKEIVLYRGKSKSGGYHIDHRIYRLIKHLSMKHQKFHRKIFHIFFNHGNTEKKEEYRAPRINAKRRVRNFAKIHAGIQIPDNTRELLIAVRNHLKQDRKKSARDAAGKIGRASCRER